MKSTLSRMRRIGEWPRRAARAIRPGRQAWRGAAWGALVALVVILVTAAYGLFGEAAPGRFVLGTLLLLAVFGLAGTLLTFAWRLLRRLPLFYTWVVACTVPVVALLVLTATSVSVGIVVAVGGALAVASLLGAAAAGLLSGGWSRHTRVQRTIVIAGLGAGLAGLGAGAAWFFDAGTPAPLPAHAAAASGASVELLDMGDPSAPGPYRVRTLFYGSGEDRHREEYGAGVDILTEPVDGSKLIDGWSALRTAYWGFGPEALPLNGRVWYPEGDGPFPLVLIVHGQHPMEDWSDPGYAYLGELLASRGFVAVSVDENFVNLSPLVDLLVVQSLREENDLRGWLLLEHLKAWRGWNRDPGSAFYGKVDLDRVALIGHSRGGEAVAVAAAFNELPYYPDDGSIRFDYGFGIRSVAAIAPVDGSYRPAGREVVLENVNYLVLHGTHDMDVFTFQGTRQYARVIFSGSGDWFKSALYIYGANHGQFNTSWGRKDLFEPVMRVFNLAQLMPGEEQQQVAKVAIGAFLEETLHGETGYRALFQDPRRGRAWLPDTIYLSRYADTATHLVSTYEEDVDLTSTTLPGGSLEGEGLSVWREQPVEAKWGNLGDHAVYLQWDGPASYRLDVPPQALPLSQESVLVFAMADAGDGAVSADEEADQGPIDLTIEVADASGEMARLPLSHFSPLVRQLDVNLGKARFMSPFPSSEAVLHHFEFPLVAWAAANPGFDPGRLVQVRFLFDRTEAGAVVLDNVGFRTTD